MRGSVRECNDNTTIHNNIIIIIRKDQKTSIECGQSAARCPWLSQSSQNKSDGLSSSPKWGWGGGWALSFSISQLKISCPGMSHISHRPWEESGELAAVEQPRKSVSSVVPLEIFFWLRSSCCRKRSTSCSSSSYPFLISTAQWTNNADALLRGISKIASD